MIIEHTSLGAVSVTGCELNGWAIGLFFERTVFGKIEAEAYLVGSENNDISLKGRFTCTRSLLAELATLDNLWDASSPVLRAIPEDLIEIEIAKLQAI